MDGTFIHSITKKTWRILAIWSHVFPKGWNDLDSSILIWLRAAPLNWAVIWFLTLVYVVFSHIVKDGQVESCLQHEQISQQIGRRKKNILKQSSSAETSLKGRLHTSEKSICKKVIWPMEKNDKQINHPQKKIKKNGSGHFRKWPPQKKKHRCSN